MSTAEVKEEIKSANLMLISFWTAAEMASVVFSRMMLNFIDLF